MRTIYRDIATLGALGARWVRRQDDRALADAAGTALAKIAAAAPQDLRDAIDGVGVWVAPSCAEPSPTRS